MEINDSLVPFEILHNIFTKLELNYAYRLSLMDKMLYNIFINEYLWKIYLLKLIKYDYQKLYKYK